MGFFSKFPTPAQFWLDVGRVWYSITGLSMLWGTLTTSASVGAMLLLLKGLPAAVQVAFTVAGVSAVLLAVGEVKRRLPKRLGFLGPRAIEGPHRAASGRFNDPTPGVLAALHGLLFLSLRVFGASTRFRVSEKPASTSWPPGIRSRKP